MVKPRMMRPSNAIDLSFAAAIAYWIAVSTKGLAEPSAFLLRSRVSGLRA